MAREFTNDERKEFVLAFTRMSNRGVVTDAGFDMGLSGPESWAIFEDPKVQTALQMAEPAEYDFDDPHAPIIDATKQVFR